MRLAEHHLQPRYAPRLLGWSFACLDRASFIALACSGAWRWGVDESKVVEIYTVVFARSMTPRIDPGLDASGGKQYTMNTADAGRTRSPVLAVLCHLYGLQRVSDRLLLS
jgi:hypothetical protein